MYETFEHTADLGLRIRADSLDRLFADAGLGLFALIVDDLTTVRPDQEVTCVIAGPDREYLFFDWLDELLHRFEPGRLLLCEFEVSVSAEGLRGVMRGEQYDPRRHRLAHEVKAITYHGLRIEQIERTWLAEVIVDI